MPCLVLTLAAVPLGGCKKRGSVATEDPGSAVRTIREGSTDVRFLEHSVVYRFDEQGRHTEEIVRKYEILTPAGVESYDSMVVAYSPWFEQRPQLEATVTTSAGETVELDPATIADGPAYSGNDVYSDARVIQAPLPAISVGAVVEQRVTLSTSRPFFSGGTTATVTFQDEVPRALARLVVEVPRDTTFEYELLDFEATVEQERLETVRRYTFTAKDVSAIEFPEFGMPSHVPRYPGIAFSTGGSWREVASAYSAILDEKLAGFEPPADVVARIQKAKTTEAKADEALEWVKSRVRYTGMEFGENAIIPFEPRKALERGYGDCKDQATLLAGTLRAAKVPATLAILRAGIGEDVRAKLPGLDPFNHVIVVIPGDSPVWIDPTVDFGRAGQLPTGDQHRLALIVDRKTDALVHTPVVPASVNTYREERDVYLDELGRSRIVETTTATGAIDGDLRSNYQATDSEIKKWLEDYAANTYNANGDPSYELTAVEDLSQPVELKLEIPGAKVAYTEMFVADAIIDYGGLWDLFPFSAFGEEEERRSDYVFNFLHDATVIWHVHPPDGFVLREDVEFAPVDLGVARLERSATEAEDNTVTIRFHLVVDERVAKPAAIERGKKAIEQLNAEPELRVSFIPEAIRKIEGGDLAGGVNAYRELARRHPKSAAYQFRYAKVLSELGLGEAARREAKKAMAVADDDPLVHASHAFLLTTNLRGRELEPGWDRKGAQDAFLRAAKLFAAAGEEDAALKYELQAAVLNEYNERGVRYASDAPLDEAVKRYDQIDGERLREFDEGAYANNAVFALMWGGRLDEAWKRWQDLPKASRVPSLGVTIAALREGTTGALSTVDRMSLRGADRSAAIVEAADGAVRLRKYTLAADLLGLAAPGAADATALRNRARLLRGIKVATKDDFEPENPGSAGAVMIAVMLRDGVVKCSEAQGLCSKELAAVSDEVEGTTMGLAASLDAWRTQLVVDMMMGDAVKTKVEGDDATGYRVEVTADLGTTQSNFTLYVVEQKGRYRIRSLAENPAETAREALAQLDRKPARGRRWLEWVAKDTGRPTSDDPADSGGFHRLWRGGKGDPKVAAAALAAGTKASGDGPLRILEGAVSGASDDERGALLRALRDAHSEREEHGAALKYSERLVKEFPTSELAPSLYLLDLALSGNMKRAEKEIAKYRSQHPDMLQYRLIETAIYESAGDYDKAHEVAEALIRDEQVEASFLNDTAWLSLFTNKTDAKDLEYALRANQRAPSVANLHTLAAVYFALGKSKDGLRTFEKLQEARGKAGIRTEDFYILGLLAEELSLADEAKRYYQQVEDLGDGDVGTYALAQRRLRAIKR